MRAGNYDSEEERDFYLERKGRSKAALMSELYWYYSHYKEDIKIMDEVEND